jgi:hypothetical protein
MVTGGGTLRNALRGTFVTFLLVAAVPCSGEDNARRDGSHDFDFNLGRWHTSIQRIKDPFAAAPQAVKLEGTVTVRPVWGGKALLEEIEADGPAGHWQGLTLFLYNRETHQWSQNYAGAAEGSFAAPPTVGEMRDGRIELHAQDSSSGRAVLVRGLWSDIRPDSHSYEEDVSDDGGRSWRPSFVARLTRIGR